MQRRLLLLLLPGGRGEFDGRGFGRGVDGGHEAGAGGVVVEGFEEEPAGFGV